MQPAFKTAYLSMGSNMGDREACLRAGLNALTDAGVIPTRVSPVYETEPVGCVDSGWYLNIAAEVETALSPEDLLRRCQEIEASLGRMRRYRNAPRTLDIDILLMGDVILSQPSLTIPHPRMTGRRFVLEPLADIAPDALHPVLKKPVSELLLLCEDVSSVFRYNHGVVDRCPNT
jgi:2-amino-4-hydroxy-6-hydroxymethyldihydropteridine diphosphokinase